MKKILFSTFFIVLLFNIAFSQKKLPELEKVKQIKVLQSTREDVKRILNDFKNDDDDERELTFSNDNASIDIKFWGGGCREGDGIWSVPSNVVTSVAIFPENEIELKDVDFSDSKFKKEKIKKEYSKDYDLHDEQAGLLVKVLDSEIYKIIFYPPKSKNGFLCSDESTLPIVSGEKRFVDIILQSYEPRGNPAPQISDLTLSKTEIVIECNKNTEQNKPCLTGKEHISITTNATYPENDPLTYNYTVSAGKIIGSGHQVIWDLSGVSPGTYTITATIDDGCGVCVAPKTETVVVK